MKIDFTFPKGFEKCLTMSYDDGVLQDRRLLEIFNKSGILCTFNLNSGFFGQHDTHRNVDHSHIPESEIKDTYKGHELAVHTSTHPPLDSVSDSELIKQVIEDKFSIEKCIDYPVIGSAYPNGAYSMHVIEMLNKLGIKYARTVIQTENFELPENFLEWKSTCRHGNPKLLELADKFLNEDGIKLYYVWGHSYEFDIDNNWDLIEKFCQKVGNNNSVWYATNGQVYEYITSFRGLVFGDENTIVYNPGSTDVYLKCDGILKIAEKNKITKLN